MSGAGTRAPGHAGRTALVTGGAGGIGWATAVQLAEAGVRVAICDLPGEAAANAASLIAESGHCDRISCHPADVSVRADVERLMEAIADEFGTLDYVVNNAGINSFTDVAMFSEEDARTTQDVNLLSILLVTTAALPLMKRAGGGAVVNVASIHGHVTTSGRVAYAASKAAVAGATRALAIDLGEHGIRVNAVSPGVIRTPMLEHSWRTKANDVPFDELERRAARVHPVRRIGEADDVASVILFLLDGAAAGFVSGIDLLVDGGAHTRFAVSTIWND